MWSCQKELRHRRGLCLAVAWRGFVLLPKHPSGRFESTDDGKVLWDCSLGEKFIGPTIPLVIKKITYWDAMPAWERGFQSEFAKKAWADLFAYEEIKAANEENPDLLERPYEDIVTEELIDSLPGRRSKI